MAIVATLVIGQDGSTSLYGNSEAITSPIDHERFLARRRVSDCLIIGGNTARSERYNRTPVPVIILSHSQPSVLAQNPRALWWNLNPMAAIKKAQGEIGENILIEGGLSLILQLLKERAIDSLELSITTAKGGENRIEREELLKYFSQITESEIEDTQFFSCSLPFPLANEKLLGRNNGNPEQGQENS